MAIKTITMVVIMQIGFLSGVGYSTETCTINSWSEVLQYPVTLKTA